MAQNQLLTGQNFGERSRVFGGGTVFMWIPDFLYWWYMKTPKRMLQLLRRVAVVIDDLMSLSLIWHNFLKPWHRDATLAGWIVGPIVKGLYLPIVLLILVLSEVFLVLLLLGWLILPPVVLFYMLVGPLTV